MKDETKGNLKTFGWWLLACWLIAIVGMLLVGQFGAKSKMGADIHRGYEFLSALAGKAENVKHYPDELKRAAILQEMLGPGMTKEKMAKLDEFAHRITGGWANSIVSGLMSNHPDDFIRAYNGTFADEDAARWERWSLHWVRMRPAGALELAMMSLAFLPFGVLILLTLSSATRFGFTRVRHYT